MQYTSGVARKKRFDGEQVRASDVASEDAQNKSLMTSTAGEVGGVFTTSSQLGVSL